MQRETGRAYIGPLVASHVRAAKPWRVLEVGCAEGGVLQAFLDAGHEGVGIELMDARAKLARHNLAGPIALGRARIVSEDIYEVDPRALEPRGFDLIVLKDVIEHIPHQERIMPRLVEFLAPGGRIFFGFPPWMMPFGGHQQIARAKRVSKMPWVHLLPPAMYRDYVRRSGERDAVRTELENIRRTGISIQRFERIVRASGLRIDRRVIWLTNPIYNLKFGIEAREQFSFLARIPYLRDLVSTAAYYVVSRSPEAENYLSTKSPSYATTD